MKFGNVTALPSVCRHHITNTSGMMMMMMMTRTQIIDTNTCLTASIGNETHCYPTFSIFLYLQKQPTHAAMFRCQLLHYPQCHPNTQPFIEPCIICTLFHILHHLKYCASYNTTLFHSFFISHC
jgi:hypothetical protein